MKYFSMFSGIGGFELGIEDAYDSLFESGFYQANDFSKNHPECVGYSEINKYAKAIYKHKFRSHKNYGNAKDIIPEEIPDFDLLVGGFPCQAFSIAGKRGGFNDTRGTLFFDVARVLKTKRPDWFLLENVKGLCSHDSGKTMRTIYGVLTDLGYTVGWEVVNSCQFGVPQNRERIFFVGHLTEAGGRVGEVLPVGEEDQGIIERAEQATVARTFTAGGNSGGLHSSMTLISHYGHKNKPPKEHSICPTLKAESHGHQPMVPEFINNTVRSSGRGSLSAKHNHDHIYDETSIRRLTPIECERLQGFPDGWTRYGIINGEKVEISDTQRYKALGNAVTVNVIEAFMIKIFKAIDQYE